MNLSIARVELRDAWRGIVTRPLLSLCKLLMLAIGIGAAASIFGVYSSFMIRALPFADSEGLVVIGQEDPDRPPYFLSNANFHVYEGARDRSALISEIGYHSFDNMTVARGDASEVVYAATTSANYFEVVRARPMIGDIYRAESALGAEPRPVLLAHGLWLRLFAGDPAVVGEQILINERFHRVVGVMGPTFVLPRNTVSEGHEIFVPVSPFEIPAERKKSRWYPTVARLVEGATLDQLSQELAGISEAVAQEWPDLMLNKRIALRPLREDIVIGFRDELRLLLAAAGLVVAIAAINLVIVGLAQATALGRAQAIKAALGGSWRHAFLGVALENLMLAVGGTALGLGLANLLALPLAGQVRGLPVAVELNDPLVWAFAVAIGLAVGLAVTVSTLLALARQGSSASGRPASGSPRVIGSGLGRALILAEVVASAVAVIVVGLLISSGLRRLELPQQASLDELFVLNVAPRADRYPESDDRLRFLERAMAEIDELPGVASVAIGQLAPHLGAYPYSFIDDFDTVTMDESEKSIRRESVTPNYFETVELRIARGRGFEARDNVPGAPKTFIVNEAAAKRYWPNADPIGRRIRINHRSDPEWAEIIGVCENQYTVGDDPAIVPFGYRPAATYVFTGSPLIVRAEPGARLSLDAIRQAIWKTDADTHIYRAYGAREYIDSTRWFSKTLTQVMILFALIVVALAAMGFLAFNFFNLSQRGAEFAIRLCLGATTNQLRAMLLGQTFRDTLAGFALGATAAYFIATWQRQFLYETSPASAPVYLLAWLLVSAIAALGALVPILLFTRRDLGALAKRG